MVDEVPVAASELQRCRIPPAGNVPPSRESCSTGSFDRLRVHMHRCSRRARPGQRGEINVVAFLKRDPLAVRGRDDFVAVGDGDVNPPITTVGLDRNEVRDDVAGPVRPLRYPLVVEDPPLRPKGGAG